MLTNEFSVRDDFSTIRRNTRPESDDPFYSEENLERLKKSIAQLERGEVVEKTLDELRQLVDR